MAKGGSELLHDPIAQDLLASSIPARLAYVWADGTPRVVALWFHWNGSDVPMARIAVQPEEVVLLDFETRFPSALRALGLVG